MLIKEQRHANTKHICSTLKFTSLENQSNCFYYQTLNHFRTAWTVSLRLWQLMKFYFSHDCSQTLESTFEQLSTWMFRLICPRNQQVIPKNPSKMRNIKSIHQWHWALLFIGNWAMPCSKPNLRLFWVHVLLHEKIFYKKMSLKIP